MGLPGLTKAAAHRLLGRPTITSNYAFTPGQSVRLAGTANATYSILGIDEVASPQAIFINNSANTRIVQSDNLGTSYTGSARTLPSGVTYATVARIVRFGAYVYMLAKDTGDNLMKVYRATPVAQAADWTDWSSALLTLTTGCTGFQFSMEKSVWGSGTEYLYVSEYGDPVGGPALHRSSDGSTWTTIIAQDATMRHHHHCKPDPYNPGHVWLTSGDGVSKTVQKSTDSGSTWSTVIASAAWQAVQISFSTDWAWFACDSRQGTVYVVDRATGTPYLAASNWHHNTTSPNPTVPPRTVTDGALTSGSATMTSATAAFTSADIGRYVQNGNALPPSTYITAVGSSTSVTLSANAGVTGTGRTISIGSDMYFANAYCGAVDPATGIYYCAAMDTSQPGTIMGLFVLNQVGGRVEVLDGGGVNVSMNTPIHFLGGYLFCGQWKRPLMTAVVPPR